MFKYLISINVLACVDKRSLVPLSLFVNLDFNVHSRDLIFIFIFYDLKAMFYKAHQIGLRVKNNGYSTLATYAKLFFFDFVSTNFVPLLELKRSAIWAS